MFLRKKKKTSQTYLYLTKWLILFTVHQLFSFFTDFLLKLLGGFFRINKLKTFVVVPSLTRSCTCCGLVEGVWYHNVNCRSRHSTKTHQNTHRHSLTRLSPTNRLLVSLSIKLLINMSAI